jgi:SAM-dependent methyltransferase
MNLATVLDEETAVNFAELKRRQQTMWASGDYAVIGTTLQIVGETLAEAVGIRAGDKVLDVAAGNGNASLAAARRYAPVTSTDYVASLLERGAERARAERFDIEFRLADAESLPFDADSFDSVLSTFGVMFTAQHDRAAKEMLRVVRSGGKIGLANWTPEGFIGQLFKIMGGYLPAPVGLRSPALWGTEPYIVSLFGPKAADIRCVRRTFNFRYRSSAHWIQVFKDFYGPALKAFAALDEAKQKALAGDITALLERLNVAGPGSLIVPGEYLEVIVVKS